jgi:hypothetical protein
MRLSRLLAAAAAPVLLLGVTITPSAADDVSNNIDASVDAAAESMSLIVGGPNKTTTLRVIPLGDDGKNGCNLTGSSTLTVSVKSSNTSVATVIPSSITFTSCGDTPVLTVQAVSVGTATVSLTQTANTTGGTFNLDPATFTANVAANTAPSVAVTGVTNGASYVKGSVPAAGCQVTDAEDGNSTKAATLSAITGPNAANGLGSQTASCSYTDAGGLTATASATYTIVSPNTAPTIAVTGVTNGASYTKGSVPTAGCQVTDTEDGNSTKAASLSAVTGPNAAHGVGSQTASCSYTDAGGLTANASATYDIVPVANTAPKVTISGVTDGGSYTKGSVPTATCNVVDTEDGNSSFAAMLSDISGPHAAKGIGSRTASCSYTDAGDITGGNQLSDQASATYDIVPVANTAPKVTISGVTDGENYVKGSVPDAVCHVVDTEDGNSSFAAQLSEIEGQHALLGIGSQTASCSYTDGGDITGEGRLSDEASATYNIVPVPNTAPVVEVTGVTEGANYEQGSVPNAACDVTDAEDTGESAAPVLSQITGPYANVGIGKRTVTCSYTDNGNITGLDKLNDQDSVTYNIVPVPNTAPVVEVTGVTEGAAYPLGSVPDAACDVTDKEDTNEAADPVLGDVTGPYAVDGIGEQTVTCSYTDKGDVTGQDNLGDQDSVTYAIVDPTAPGIVYSVLPAGGPNGDNGWYRSNVTVDWTVTEVESPSSLETTGCSDVSITSDQVATTYTCSASSAGGDFSRTTVSIKRDATDPSLVVNGGPAAGGSYLFGEVPATPTCSATDSLSGVVAGGCTINGYSSAVGQHTVVISVKDNAGNTTMVSRTYAVQAWTTKGFYAPVDMNGVFNVVKGGSTVPLKFEVFSGTTELTTTAAIESFTAKRVSCMPSAATDDVELLTTGGTSLRYDSTGGQFIQNWKTPTGAGTCYSTTMTAADGSSITAYFKLK